VRNAGQLHGQLVDGVWRQIARPASKEGHFNRVASAYLDTMDKSKFLDGDYTLIVSSACPWSHRITLLRQIYNLQKVLPLIEVNAVIDNNGWEFLSSEFDAKYLYELYQRTDKNYTGKVTVPVIWDRINQKIVCNESNEIINQILSFYPADSIYNWRPEHLLSDIANWSDRIYEPVNNGVYRAGFASTQKAYDEAFFQLFEMLWSINQHLKRSEYLCGDRITEADWRLFVTLVRFDAVYHTHFKCNAYRLSDYPVLFAYARELYQIPQVAETVDFKAIKTHYFKSHKHLNPSGIIPKGPIVNWLAPHGRHISYF